MWFKVNFSEKFRFIVLIHVKFVKSMIRCLLIGSRFAVAHDVALFRSTYVNIKFFQSGVCVQYSVYSDVQTVCCVSAHVWCTVYSCTMRIRNRT